MTIQEMLVFIHDKGMKYKEIAEEVGLHPSNICRLINGETDRTMAAIEIISLYNKVKRRKS